MGQFIEGAALTLGGACLFGLLGGAARHSGSANDDPSTAYSLTSGAIVGGALGLVLGAGAGLMIKNASVRDVAIGAGVGLAMGTTMGAGAGLGYVLLD